MGGNKLQGVELRRYKKEEYFALQKRVKEILLQNPIITSQFAFLKAYENKLDFGDLDVLCVKPKPDAKKLTEILEKEFHSKKISAKGEVASFEFEQLQIDLIYVAPESFEMAQFYFAFNDLGNLMSKVAHKFGLKYGAQGLEYPVRNVDTGTILSTLLVSRDPKRIVEFLGYNYATVAQGFKDLEDIFLFMISSPYFCSSSFSEEKLSKLTKKKVVTRKTYQKFVEYLKQHKITKEASLFYEEEGEVGGGASVEGTSMGGEVSRERKKKDKETFIPMIDEAFPEAQLGSRCRAIMEDQKKRKTIADKFNGKVVMSLIPELKANGKQLNQFITAFKEHVNSSATNSVTTNSSCSDVVVAPEASSTTTGAAGTAGAVAGTSELKFSNFDLFVLASTPQQVHDAILNFKTTKFDANNK